MQQGGVFYGGRPRAGVARLVSLVFGALAGAVLTFWLLRLWNTSAPAPLPRSTPPAPLHFDAQALAHALGAGANAAPVSAPSAVPQARYVLLGVLAGHESGAGAAVIAVGQQPGRPFRVGAAVDGALVLQSLSAHEAHLAPRLDGPATLTLRLKLPAPLRLQAGD